MKQVKTGSAQSIWDLANRYYGSVNGVEQLMIDNPTVLNFNYTIAPGTVVNIDESKVINALVVDFLEARKINPNTAVKILPPELTASLGNIDFGNVAIATPSAAVMVHISGKNLQSNVVLSLGDNFILNDNGGVDNNSPITLYQIGGIVEKDLFVRFKPDAVADYAGALDAVHSAGTVTVTLRGHGI